jgi:hypothetical protein
MSELTYSQFDSSEILDPDRWIRLTDSGGILLDPATAEPFDGFPDWVQSDERLQEGRDHLGKIAAGHCLTIVYSQHASALDLGISRRFERLVGNADVLAFEGLGWLRIPHELDMGLARYEGYYPAKLREWLNFERRWKSAVAKNHIPSFSYDVSGDSEIPLDLLLKEILLGTTDRVQDVHPIHRKSIKLGAQMLREHYIPGKYGYEMQRNGRIPDDSSGLMIIGSGHEDVSRKFDEQGLTPENTVRFGRNPRSTFPETMRTGRVMKSIAFFGIGDV